MTFDNISGTKLQFSEELLTEITKKKLGLNLGVVLNSVWSNGF